MKKMHQFYGSNQDMYKIAAENNIYIIEENLGNQIAGYYNNTFGEKLIHVNSEIPRYYKKFVIAYFLPKNTNKCTSTEEISCLSMESANKFIKLERAM